MSLENIFNLEKLWMRMGAVSISAALGASNLLFSNLSHDAAAKVWLMLGVTAILLSLMANQVKKRVRVEVIHD